MLRMDPRTRGYLILYHAGQHNHCPGCGRCNWEVGRTMAECAFCATALPIAEVGVTEALPTFFQSRDTGLQENARQTPLLMQSTMAAMLVGSFIVSMAG